MDQIVCFDCTTHHFVGPPVSNVPVFPLCTGWFLPESSLTQHVPASFCFVDLAKPESHHHQGSLSFVLTNSRSQSTFAQHAWFHCTKNAKRVLIKCTEEGSKMNFVPGTCRIGWPPIRWAGRVGHCQMQKQKPPDVQCCTRTFC